MSRDAPNAKGVPGIRLPFRDKDFIFVYSTDQKYWGFQKDLVLALCELGQALNNQDNHFNKSISNELEKIYRFIPNKVIINFSDKIPTSDTRLPLVTVMKSTSYLQRVDATLYLAEFWNEIRRSSRSKNQNAPSVVDYQTHRTGEERERALLGLTDVSEEIIPLRLGALKVLTMQAPIGYTFLRALAMILDCCHKAE